jgi:heat shock protein HslJ
VGTTLKEDLMQRRSLLLALPLLGVLALMAIVGTIAFAARPSTPGASGASVSLTQASWTLTRLLVDGKEQPLVPGRAPTLQFRTHDGTIVGTDGCNSYFGPYTLQGERLHLGELGQTLVGCLEAGVGQQENTYMSALRRVTRVQVAGATLTLSSDDGAVQLTFETH